MVPKWKKELSGLVSAVVAAHPELDQEEVASNLVDVLASVIQGKKVTIAEVQAPEIEYNLTADLLSAAFAIYRESAELQAGGQVELAKAKRVDALKMFKIAAETPDAEDLFQSLSEMNSVSKLPPVTAEGDDCDDDDMDDEGVDPELYEDETIGDDKDGEEDEGDEEASVADTPAEETKPAAEAAPQGKPTTLALDLGGEDDTPEVSKVMDRKKIALANRISISGKDTDVRVAKAMIFNR